MGKDKPEAKAELSLAKAGAPAHLGATGARKPGGMAGEIWIAADFDELPSEIAEVFGATSGH